MHKVLLLVDNNRVYSQSYVSALKSQGFRVIAASNFETAKVLFNKHKDDLNAIILACSLGSNPSFDPFPFAKYIREKMFTGVVIGTSNSQSQIGKMKQNIHFTEACKRDSDYVLSWAIYYLKWAQKRKPDFVCKYDSCKLEGRRDRPRSCDCGIT